MRTSSRAEQAKTRHTARLLAVSLALALLPALALVGLGEAIQWPFLRGPVQRAASHASGVPVSLAGRFRARLLWQTFVEVEQLRIGPGGGLALPHLLDGRAVRVRWRWSDLWRWWQGAPLRLRTLSAEALDVQLVRDDQGHASWHLGPRDAPTPARSAGNDPPRVDALHLADGHIHVDDAPLGTRLDIAVEGGEAGAGSGRTSPGYRFSLDGRWKQLPLQLHGSTGGALPLLQAADDQTPAITLAVEGQVAAVQLSFSGRAASLLQARRLEGRLALGAPSLAVLGDMAGLPLPQTPPVQASSFVRLNGGIWELQGTHARIGRSQLGGDFRFDGTALPPRLTGRLEGARLFGGDLGPSVGTAVPASAAAAARRPAMARGARVLPRRRFDLPSLKAMDADLQLALDELDFGTAALGALHALRGRLLLRRGALELQQLQADTAGGHIEGWSRMDSEAQPAQWSAKLQLSQVDVARWLVVTRRYLSGRLQADVDLKGSGGSTAEILSTLEGRASMRLREGSLSHLVTEMLGLDLAQALGVAVRGDEPLPLRCAFFDLRAAQGVVTPRTAVLDNRNSTLRIGGRIDLGSEALALVLRVEPKDFSPLTLRSPVTLSGTLGAPQLGVDMRRLAGRTLGAVVLGAVAGPVAALLPLLDPGAREAGDPCAMPAAAAAPNGR